MNNSENNLSRFTAAMDALRRAKAGVHERLGEGLQLTRTQLEILNLLAEMPQTTGELAKRLFLTQSAVTQTIDTLVRRALVERQPDEHDRRIIQLHLSTAGQKLSDQLHALRHDHLTALVNRLTETEIEVFISVAHKLIDQLEAMKSLPKPLNEDTK